MLNISIVIPVKNGEQTLGNCLNAIKEQTVFPYVEILILDSESTDRSVEIAKQFGAKIITIPNGTFNHGLTRNIGVDNANGDILFFTVQDASLAENNMLERMAAHFNDVEVMGVVGHQATPHHLDKNPAAWFVRYSKPEVEKRHFTKSSPFSNLSKEEQFQLSSWDDVCAMYRKSALLRIPFRKTNFSEDWLWANEALNNNMLLLRDPSIIVWHYHFMSFGYTFKSKFIIHYNFYIYFNRLSEINWSPINTIKNTYSVFKNKQLKLASKFYWTFHNIVSNFASFLSVLLFRSGYAIGDKMLLDKLYIIICKEVPQGGIKNK